jgi:hypothetical protein
MMGMMRIRFNERLLKLRTGWPDIMPVFNCRQ